MAIPNEANTSSPMQGETPMQKTAIPVMPNSNPFHLDNGKGLMNPKNLDELDAEQKVKEAQMALALAKPKAPMLADYIDRCFSLAKDAKKSVEQVLLASQMQRDGEYSEQKKKDLESIGDPLIFIRLTDTKCGSFESQMNDILGIGQKALVEPTPIPDLPPDIINKIVEKTMEELRKQSEQLGEGAMDAENAYNMAKMMRDSMEKQFQKSAKDTSILMSKEIEDVYWEGGFYTALSEVIKDMSTFKTCIMKAVLREVDEFNRWEKNVKTGRWTPKSEKKIKMVFERVSPLDWFPAPRASNIKDCYVLEKVAYSRKSLAGLLGNESYNQDAIKELLENFSRSGVTEATTIDQQRITVEGKGDSLLAPQVKEVENFEGLEFYGSVQGSMLLELGVETLDEDDRLKEFDIWAIKIGDKIIKVEINSDIFAKKPYFYTSFEKRIGNVWGFGIPEKMEPLQNICNAMVRALCVNASYGAGPQTSINLAALTSNEEISTVFPRKIWQYRDSTGILKDPVHFFNIPMIAEELMGIYEKFKNESDDITGIPRYAYGNQDVSGAAATARGLSMLMGAATKTIKRAVKNVDDDIITQATNFVFNYIMLTSDKEDIKGDLKPRSRGSLTIAAKEELNAARQNFLALTANEFDMPIIGINGRAAILREIVKGLDMDDAEIIPSKEQLSLQEQIEALKAKIAEQTQVASQLAQQRQIQSLDGAGGLPPPPAPSPSEQPSEMPPLQDMGGQG